MSTQTVVTPVAPVVAVLVVSETDVLTAVTEYVGQFARPCPAKFLEAKFGDEVDTTINSLKESGILLGLRGRNGGLAMVGSDIVAKRGEHAVKKALKAAEKAAKDALPIPGLEVIDPAQSA
jgi:hypothetical protein